MSKHVRQVALCCALAFTSAAALAADGLYAGGGLGWWTADDAGFEDTAPAVRAFGGYRFNDYLSLQADYVYGTELQDGGVDIDAWGIETALRPSFPIGRNLEVYGRLGWGHYEYEASAGGFGVDGSEDEFVWALGGAYQTSTPWSFFVERAEPNDSELAYWTLGASYQFQR